MLQVQLKDDSTVDAEAGNWLYNVCKRTPDTGDNRSVGQGFIKNCRIKECVVG